MSTRNPHHTNALSTSRSQHYHELAQARIAGGVNSNVRLRGTPLCFAGGKAAHLIDLDGNEYLDYALGMGPNILGHAPQRVIEEVARLLSTGQLFAGQHPLELQLAEEICKCLKSAELVRFGLSGSEMVQAAIRVARAHTGRPRIIKFEGHYHGWLDNIFVNVSGPAAPAAAPLPRPIHLQSAGQSPHASADVVVLPWNDFEAVGQYMAANAGKVAAIITEPMMFNTGGILPREGYLQHLRRAATAHGAVLIFDEVITGFRVALGGAQEIYGVQPDLSIFAKALGAGFPIAALVGRRDIMKLFTSGVNHSGTYNANVVSISAALAALRELSAADGSAYRQINAHGQALMDGIAATAKSLGIDMQISGVPAAFHTCFASHPIHDYTTYMQADHQRLREFLAALLECRVRPTFRGTWFVSAAHTDSDVEATLAAVDRALKRLDR